jgi:FkbH-like protein
MFYTLTQLTWAGRPCHVLRQRIRGPGAYFLGVADAIADKNRRTARRLRLTSAQSAPKLPPADLLMQVKPELFARHNGSQYRTPNDLQVTPSPPARFLVVGGCLAESFPLVASMIDKRHKGDFVLHNNFEPLPEIPEAQTSEYDFQIVHIPLRSILGNAYFLLPEDGSGHEEFLSQTQEYLGRYLSNCLALNAKRKLLTFVLGFLVPQQNPLGRFAPRYDLRNVMHLIERLNMFLAEQVAKHQNVHFVDLDQISAGIGKKSCQDDMVWSFVHGTTLSDGDHDHDLNRIEPPAPMQQHYSARWLEFYEALLHEVLAMWRTTLQLDAVKLVAVDLDDTLWRGVAAEGTLGVAEGWPMGFVEALLFLKKRGIILAIVSKNDQRFVESNWHRIVQGQISLDDFAIRKINFDSKAKNLADILREVNLRPQNVVMIDDHPVERAAIRQQLPGVRVLGSHLYYLKRILLWSSETQQSLLTPESGRRTEMVQAQLHRENTRKTLTHEEFLHTLGLRVRVTRIRDIRHVQMLRALELFNKTNQFNTTGTRYTLMQCHQLLAAGCELHVLEAEDRFTQYGLIGAVWVADNCIEHWVMSCRALGLGIEESFLAYLSGFLAARSMPIMLGKLRPTDANAACQPIYRRNGFASADSDPTVWSRSLATPLLVPPHVTLTATATEPEKPSLTVQLCCAKIQPASRPVGPSQAPAAA